MSNKSILKAGLIAVSLLATSIASADIYFGGNASSYDFDAANTAGAGYVGYFTYDGGTTRYGVDNANFDFTSSSVPEGFTRLASTQTIDGTDRTVVYRFYKQPYSTVIGNIASGTGSVDREFVKGVVGTPTNTSTLTDTSYTYSGVAFNQNISGDFDYEVNVSNTGVVTGSGSISNISGNRPSYGAFTLSGDLDTVTFATDSSGNLQAASGSTTLYLTDVASNVTDTYTDSTYSLGIYGPDAAEVAGGITGGQVESLISGFGLAGTVTP